MYQDLKVSYWLYGMKHEVVKYVALCDTCQRVKVEHQCPAGLLQQLKVPKWKWKKLVWILSWGYQELKGDMILYGYSRHTD
jgi:hypothetical protein